VHLTASSHFESVTAVMSFLLIDVTLLLKDACSASAQLAKLCLTSNTSSQLEMKTLMKKLDDLFLLKSVKLYYNS